MEGLLKQFFDQKLGLFIKSPDREGFALSFVNGEFTIKNAEIRSETFENLHFPFELKGGFIDELTLTVPLFGRSEAEVKIKNVLLVVRPHDTDWSWKHVFECKCRLIDLIMKLMDLTSSKKKRTPNVETVGLFGDMKKKMIEDVKAKVFGMLEVHIQNVHILYEDSRRIPFVCGFKIGLIDITSKAKSSNLRTTGNWKQNPSILADPLFCQAVVARRICAYLDHPQNASSMFSSQPLCGPEAHKKFIGYSCRETFSACVVDVVLSQFPPDHKRRLHLEGPSFRERLDFHRFVLFPVRLEAHITVNKMNDVAYQQRVPMKDADVIVEPLQLAIDSEQIRSVNDLLSFRKDFAEKDALFLTRPRASIGECRDDESRKLLVREWWNHALHGVRLHCNIPVSCLNAAALRKKSRLRVEYLNLCKSQYASTEVEGQHLDKAAIAEKLHNIEITVPLAEILHWRREVKMEGTESLRDGDSEEVSMNPRAARSPSTWQLRAQIEDVTGYFLIAVTSSDAFVKMMAKIAVKCNKYTVREAMLALKVQNVVVDAVQRGRGHHRIARWCEFGIGSLNVINCTASKAQPKTRQVLNMQPFQGSAAKPFCLYVALTTFVMFDRHMEGGDVQLGAVLEPSEGVSAHLKRLESKEEQARFEKLRFLREYRDEVGRLMMFVFVQAGQATALHYAPFWRRISHFLKRGTWKRVSELTRQPSSEKQEKELLTVLQRKVEKLTGKSDMLGVVEGITHGVRGRLVDHYNSQHVLCKEGFLAAMKFKILRNGRPQTFHMQFHQMLRAETADASFPSGEQFGLLPWKVSMLLLPKSEFVMGEPTDEQEEGVEREQVSVVKVPTVVVPRRSPIEDAHIVLVHGSTLLKWGRNGKWKERFVQYDETHNIIVWKPKASDRMPAGIVPMCMLQDVVIGIQTPVMKNIKNPKLRGDTAFSIISKNRTLDLQADSTNQRDHWVSGAKALYKAYVQKQVNLDSRTGTPFHFLEEVTLPKGLERKLKTYQPKFRSDKSSLKTALIKFHQKERSNEILHDDKIKTVTSL